MMHQRDLLPETRDFILPEERKQRGIELHEKYSDRIIVISIIILAGSYLHWTFFGYNSLLFFSGILLVMVVSIELLFKKYFKFTGRDAVKYYAVQVYDEPTQEAVSQLNSWNKNPFDLLNEYYYPQLNTLVEEAQSKDNPPEYIKEQIPDLLRYIERQERQDYNTLVDLENLEIQLENQYVKMIQEANYCYKFGAYMSVSVLLRKITENLIVDILMGKGLYSELPDEAKFPEMVELFTEEVLYTRVGESMSEEFEESIDVWIRKKGNKGAHKPEEFTQDEIETLMNHAQRSIRLLLVIKSELYEDSVPEEINRDSVLKENTE